MPDASGAPPVVLLLFKEGNRLYSYHLKWDQIPPTKLYNLLPHLQRAEQTDHGHGFAVLAPPAPTAGVEVDEQS